MREEDILHSGSFIDKDDNAIRVSFFNNTRMRKPGIYPDPETVYEMTLTTSFLDFPSIGGTKDFGVTVIPFNDNVKIRNPRWSSVSESYINGNTIYFTVGVENSTDDDEKTGVITVVIDGTEYDINLDIRQAGVGGEVAPSYTVVAEPASLVFNQDGGFATVELYCNPWNANLKMYDSSRDWISISEQFTTEHKKIYMVSCDEYETTGKRSTNLRAGVEGITSSEILIPVVQENESVPPVDPIDPITAYDIKVSTSIFTLSRAGGTVSFDVECNGSYEVIGPVGYWITMTSQVNPMRPHITTYTLRYETNDTGARRRSSVTFQVPGVDYTLYPESKQIININQNS